MIARYIGIGLGIALAAVVAIWQIQVSRMEARHFRDIAAEKQKTADVQNGWDAYKLQVEQGISDQAAIRANENLAALDRERALQAEADRLRSQAATATRQRNEASAALLKALANAPQTDVSPLDLGSREFFARLRAQQTTRAPDNPPPAR